MVKAKRPTCLVKAKRPTCLVVLTKQVSTCMKRWSLLIILGARIRQRGRGSLMVSALVPGSSGPGSSPGRGHCVVFLGKTLYSHSASLHPGV